MDRFVDRVTVQMVQLAPSVVRLRGICAASAPEAPGRTSHNPPVVGSSLTRPNVLRCLGREPLTCGDARARGSTRDTPICGCTRSLAALCGWPWRIRGEKLRGRPAAVLAQRLGPVQKLSRHLEDASKEPKRALCY